MNTAEDEAALTLDPVLYVIVHQYLDAVPAVLHFCMSQAKLRSCQF